VCVDLVGTCKDQDFKIKKICEERDRTLIDLNELHEVQIKAFNTKVTELQNKNESDKLAFLAESENLNAKMNDLNTKLFLKNNKISKIVIDMNRVEVILQKVNEELKQAKIHIRDLENKLSDKTEENLAMNQTLIEKSKEINLLVTERNQMSADIENLNSTVVHRQNEIISMRNKIHELEARVKELNDLLKKTEAETEAKIKKLNVNFRQMNKERDEMKQECQRLNQVRYFFFKL